MGTIHSITDLTALSPIERGALKNYLVKHNLEIDVVQTQFEQIFGKRVSAQVIKSLLVNNEKEIKELQKFWYDNPDQEELFHISVRLRKWLDLYNKALRPDQVILNTKVDKDKWGIEKREDLKTAAAILKNAAWDKHTWQGLENDKLKITGEGDDAGSLDDEPVVTNWSRKA